MTGLSFIIYLIGKAVTRFSAGFYRTKEMERELWNRFHQGIPVTPWHELEEKYGRERGREIKQDRIRARIEMVLALLIVLSAVVIFSLLLQGHQWQGSTLMLRGM